jgi:hypothetical protein
MLKSIPDKNNVASKGVNWALRRTVTADCATEQRQFHVYESDSRESAKQSGH